MRKLLVFFLLFVGILSTHASSMDKVRISLLTCAPGSEIYALFGHSAIRYENPDQQQDWVFNYGMFSFRRIVLAPVVILLGMVLEIWAIMHIGKSNEGGEQ